LVIRIDKHLSNAGYGSRKEIKTLIRQKRVSCDGKLVTDPGLKIIPESRISIDSELVSVITQSTLMMNKPSGYLSSNEDDGEYPSVMELLSFPHPDYSIAGRLDADTTGLLILSTDGQLVHRIISPKKEVQKLYIAEVLPFDLKKTALFFKGIEIENGYVTKPVTHFELKDEAKGNFKVLIGITEGKYHQVKRMFQAVGSEVLTLHRQSIGDLMLDETLHPGEYREINEDELQKLFVTNVK